VQELAAHQPEAQARSRLRFGLVCRGITQDHLVGGPLDQVDRLYLVRSIRGGT